MKWIFYGSHLIVSKRILILFVRLFDDVECVFLFFLWRTFPPSTPAFLFVVPPRKKSSVQVGAQSRYHLPIQVLFQVSSSMFQVQSSMFRVQSSEFKVSDFKSWQFQLLNYSNTQIPKYPKTQSLNNYSTKKKLESKNHL